MFGSSSLARFGALSLTALLRDARGQWSGRRLRAAVEQAWRAYWERRARRATAEFLHRLDDRALREIGICRADIDWTIYGCAGPCARHARPC